MESGHATAAPPSATSNSRRPMVTVIRPSRARRVKETIPRHEGAVFIFKEGAVAPQPPPRLQQRLFLRRLDRIFDIFHGRELDVPELAVHPFNLTVSSATALTEVNAMNAPAINLHHIGLSSHQFEISRKPG